MSSFPVFRDTFFQLYFVFRLFAPITLSTPPKIVWYSRGPQPARFWLAGVEAPPAIGKPLGAINLVIPNPRQRARAFTSVRVGVRDLVFGGLLASLCSFSRSRHRGCPSSPFLRMVDSSPQGNHAALTTEMKRRQARREVDRSGFQPRLSPKGRNEARPEAGLRTKG